jgi:hypothetical protein
MKISELKQIIKEACKEAFREEMKEILLEAIKSPKTIVQESKQVVRENQSQDNQSVPRGNISQNYRSLMEGMKKGTTELISEPEENLISQSTLGQIPINTISEGSSLPTGEVGLDLIMHLTGGNKK